MEGPLGDMGTWLLLAGGSLGLMFLVGWKVGNRAPEVTARLSAGSGVALGTRVAVDRSWAGAVLGPVCDTKVCVRHGLCYNELRRHPLQARCVLCPEGSHCRHLGVVTGRGEDTGLWGHSLHLHKKPWTLSVARHFGPSTAAGAEGGEDRSEPLENTSGTAKGVICSKTVP